MSIKLNPATGRLRNDIRVVKFARDFAATAAPYFAQHGWTWDNGVPHVPSVKEIAAIVIDLMDQLDAQPAAVISNGTGRIYVERGEDDIWYASLQAQQATITLPEYQPSPDACDPTVH